MLSLLFFSNLLTERISLGSQSRHHSLAVKMSTIALIYGILMIAGSSIFMIGRMGWARGTIFAKMSYGVQTLPSFAGKWICILAYLGNVQRGTARWLKIESYFTEQRNPVLQMFYLVLVLPAFFVYHLHCLPYFDTLEEQVVGSVYCMFGLFTFLVACYAPNGVVKKGEKSLQDTRFERDGLFYTKKVEDCRTCKVPRPARSKHCRLCGHCVRRFDHHCAWLNCDVGEENLRWFHLFLVTHWTLCVYATVTTMQLVFRYIAQKRLWAATFVDGRGNQYAATPFHIMLHLLRHLPFQLALSAFCTLVAIMLFFFWLVHLRMAFRNLTTNETYKISDLLDYCENRLELKNEWSKELEKRRQASGDSGGKSNGGLKEWSQLSRQDIEEYLSYPTFTDYDECDKLANEYIRLVEEDKLKPSKAKNQLEKKLRKTYCRGSSWSNLVEMLSPTSFLPQSKTSKSPPAAAAAKDRRRK